jgi:hypothetical protein
MKTTTSFLAGIMLLLMVSHNAYTQYAPFSYIPDDTVCQNSLISVPVKVNNFVSIGAVSLRIEYDTTVMTFNLSQTVFNPSLYGAIISSNPITGGSPVYKIIISWVGFVPVSLADGSTLVSLGFNFKTGGAYVTFNNSANQGQDCEYANAVGDALIDDPTASYYSNGLIANRIFAGYVLGGGTISLGQNTGPMTLTGYDGTILNWQRQLDNGGYSDIPGTGGMTVYSEVPASAGTWDYRASVRYGNCNPQVSSPATVIVQSSKTLNVAYFIEALYDVASGTMKKMQECINGNDTYDKFPSTDVDTVSIYLADAASPWATVFQSHGLFIKQDGSVQVLVPAAFSGRYYIVITQRQSVETWSAEPVSFTGSTISYDFTSSAGQAYGNNEKQLSVTPPAFGIFSGDITSMSGPKDEYVDIFDNNAVFNAAQLGAFGYIPEDLTGDAFVDIFDNVIVFNNAQLGAGLNTPPNPAKK